MSMAMHCSLWSSCCISCSFKFYSVDSEAYSTKYNIVDLEGSTTVHLSNLQIPNPTSAGATTHERCGS